MSKNIVVMSHQSKVSATAWKKEMANMLREPEELCELLNISGVDKEQLKAACELFPLRIPRPYLSRIKAGDLNDPLLLQALPQKAELLITEGYVSDPLEEAKFTPVPGLLHKYHGRVLIVLNGSCAIHCRYCFRRHFPYQEHQIGAENWQQILDYISADDSIQEVIFSGGDPLSCTDKVLARRCEDLSAINHVNTLRLHSRLPIMIPQRIDDHCLSWMQKTRLKVVMVIHANHAQELDDEVADALGKLAAIGVLLLNQSVLLKGVNDSVEALEALSRRLLVCDVMPYYLHVFDAVQGAAHFDIGDDASKILLEELKSQVAGYLVPKLVREHPEETSKTSI
ncbi:EF-P beta-lysylation protein EpmB [Leucothrix arctica]|uniref:L-lysine 2,3-aminomutase n=1 Tax=Leucothrix arctica TaxID=1481894 RepID=A0A317CCE8_9GAMM|nr:EF-P beta-lysylation protein EpmB [Leucothrix arctica]PWQ96304.1 EF-P beta-lysylation protein EpmB [Leucothrix arctica]